MKKHNSKHLYFNNENILDNFRNLAEVKEDEEGPSSKRIRNSPISKGNSFECLQLGEINSWSASFLHSSVLPPIHNWWIQQYSIFNHPFFPTLSSISYERQAGEVLQHHQYVLSESPLT